MGLASVLTASEAIFKVSDIVEYQDGCAMAPC
jgi:hypothetical protein